MTKRFDYLIDRIKKSEFQTVPFKHIIIDDFFKKDDFEEVISSNEIKLAECSTTQELMKELKSAGYQPIPFPGSITDENDYLKFLETGQVNRSLIKGYGKKVIEGYGITYRLNKIANPLLEEIMSTIESDAFQTALIEKFGITGKTQYEGGIQKNLQGYEISPHPDTSRKALTWMVNIYTNDDDVSEKDMHTHLCRLQDRYSYVSKVWQHGDYDPCWVPWDWSDTVKKTNTNNSISIFRPSYDTLHAVSVQEGHLKDQRNQIYGNLWYGKSQKPKNLPWEKLDLYRNANILERGLRKLNII
jgi:hypothetical protein